ncbi:hypothetical protein ABID21_002619 [Pseudorhizobium tarimense]|uniref:Uncharacterized protein n=1 Tax=Pseudorhizobium tarimense TaxID=1079109 RepID=A0ABV2H7L1_9HYPH|nr:hypothetical protein [Pseudorhizobium tarimense]MCJ8519658.1 hypothetical protein [Pseudorhizobium tarimense]
MADFVAVIRRAVDGLAKNTPEMREKVYDKARGAVRRQLENMKPAPPESMLQRQMEKLEAAIVSVEAEHEEALPAVEPVTAPIVASEPDYEEAPYEAPAAAEAYDRPSEEAYEPEASVPAQWPEEDRAAAAPEEVYAAPEAPQTFAQEQEPASYAEPAFEQQDEPPYEPSAADHEPVSDQHDDQSAADEGLVAPVHGADESWPPREEAETYAGGVHDGNHVSDASFEDRTAPEPLGIWPTSDADQPQDERSVEAVPGEQHDWTVTEPAPNESEVVAPSWEDERQELAAPAADDSWQWPEEQPAQAEAAWQDVPDLTPEPASSAVPETVDAHFDQETRASVSSVRMPSTDDFLPFGQPQAAHEHPGHDSFEEALRVPGDSAAAAASPAAKDPWEDIEELIGYNQNAMPAGGAASNADDMVKDADMVPPPPRPYRVAPKKRNYTAPILALIGLIIVAAGGYALWLNRDVLSEVVGLAGEEPTAVAPSGEAADGIIEEPTATAGDDAAPAEQTATDTEATAPATPEVAASNKFTQRLLPDGTEVDQGPGPADGAGSGQSVAQLNAPPSSPAEAGDAGASAAPAGEAAPTATPADTAALSGEKMFLYEERVGQTAPTAIEGAVSWSLQREANANGVQEPVVQGRVNIPGRGLTALITFKRNTDASLPASHLVEVVFAVPPGFEGGAIDSVQRIAMKQTEQDRGDALIAVPAKITDDFHMIALNDFPDARATNLELLRTRNWMDIPVTYRNGRRALLTLQKGEEGTQTFNEAIREWQSLSNDGNTGQ